MPFLIAILGPEVARPAVILIGQTAGIVYIYQYRNDWQFSDIKILLIGTLIGIPIGTWLVDTIDENTFMLILGVITLSYAIYGLSGLRLPEMHRYWASFFGLWAGILHSAYNVGGPPLVMYNSTHDWQAKRFKGNIQAVFFVMRIFIIFEHFRVGNVTNIVIQNYLLMAPTMAIALVVGFYAEKYIKQETFRKLVLILLLIIGLKLLF